jgi:hypothetical protein
MNDRNEPEDRAGLREAFPWPRVQQSRYSLFTEQPRAKLVNPLPGGYGSEEALRFRPIWRTIGSRHDWWCLGG